MKYSYYFKSDSGDSMHIISENHYETAVDFMKNEFIGEYEAWKDENTRTMKYRMQSSHVRRLNKVMLRLI